MDDKQILEHASLEYFKYSKEEALRGRFDGGTFIQ